MEFSAQTDNIRIKRTSENISAEWIKMKQHKTKNDKEE
jgi:hypothetical protein